jgi:hypothetical protein
MFLLHKATINGLSVHLVKLLILAFPESGTTQDEHGMVPLHYACMKRASDISMDIVTVLADEFLKICTITNYNGKNAVSTLERKCTT